ncbi:MAG: cytochrome P450 [Rhizomicrobium sp.]
MTITREEELSLLNPGSYHKHGYPWQIWEKLRRDDPIRHVERETGESCWAVTRYQDIVSIEANTDVFKNGPKLTMGVDGQNGLRMIVGMDPPDHTAHRAIANPHFMPRNIEWVNRYAEEIVTEALDRAMERNGEIIDLQDNVANLVPTAVISAYLGAPREMWPRIIEWTNQIINANDPRVAKDQTALQVTGLAVRQMCQVYAGVFEDRRKNPRDDFPTALVNARIDGKPMGENELFSWAIILMTAGHETTQSTFGLGVHALLQHPDQFSKLKSNPQLLPRAIDELLRYLSPAIHFVRTPDRDVEIRGKKIRAGEHLVMFYPSANRDAEIFEDPDRLDIERFPNRHLAFGTGPHQCLGMHLARLELKVMFEQFLQRVEKIEIAGEPENVYAIATGGYKHFPVRMTVRPKA